MNILKKILPVAGLVAGLAMLPIAANAAQSIDDQGQALNQKAKKKGKKGKRGHHGKAFKKALKNADLDADTQARIKNVFESYKPQLKAMHQEVKNARAKGDILQVQAARLQADEKRLEMMTDVRAQLSDTQWASINESMKAMRAEHKQKRKGKRGKRE